MPQGASVFIARVSLRASEREVEVDCRPSDALSLAVRCDAPFLVDENVFATSSTVPNSPETPQGKTSSSGRSRSGSRMSRRFWRDSGKTRPPRQLLLLRSGRRDFSALPGDRESRSTPKGTSCPSGTPLDRPRLRLLRPDPAELALGSGVMT